MRHVWPEREAVVRAGAEVRVQGPAGVFDLARVAVERVAIDKAASQVHQVRQLHPRHGEGPK